MGIGFLRVLTLIPIPILTEKPTETHGFPVPLQNTNPAHWSLHSHIQCQCHHLRNPTPSPQARRKSATLAMEAAPYTYPHPAQVRHT